MTEYEEKFSNKGQVIYRVECRGFNNSLSENEEILRDLFQVI